MTLVIPRHSVDALRPIADKLGNLRQRWNDSQGLRAAYNFSGDGAAIHRMGALAEACVATIVCGEISRDNVWWGKNTPAADTYWNAYREVVDYDDVPDIAPRYDVRSTTHRTGRLLLHPKDCGDRIFILIRLLANGTAECPGWIWGHDGKRQEFWQHLQSGRPCYVVPNDKLLPAGTWPK